MNSPSTLSETTTTAVQTLRAAGAAADPALLGGKAATLARLGAAGLPVPEGVVLGTEVFAEAVRALPAPDGDVDPGALTLPGAAAAALLEATAAWRDVPLAVRSSGVAEDGADASFAGLYETVLDVRGEQALLDAVLVCWRSAFGARVRGYARAGAPAGLAVLVQPMVDADAAGVAFTADPVTGATDRIVIDAVAGVADGLVSGAVAPQRWVVQDGSRPRLAGDGGPDALDAAGAAAVAALARDVECLQGTPQDVEWAISAGRPVLLQARPITALGAPEVGPQVEPVPVDEEVPPGYWAREASHAPTPWHPLSREVLSHRTPALTRVSAELGYLFDTLEFRDIRGWEYIHVVPLGGKEAPRLPGWATALAVRLVPALRERVRTAARAAQERRAQALIERWEREWVGRLSDSIVELRDTDLTALADEALAEHLRRTMRLAEEGTNVHFRLHGALALVLGELAFVARDLLGWDDVQALALLGGTSHRSTEPARALAALAALARRRPALAAAIQAGAPPADVLALDPGFAEAFAGYLRDYGCRGLRYELAEPNLDEQPELVLALVRDQLATGYDPAGQDRALAAAREEAQATARRLLAGRPAGLERFERALRDALQAYPVREDNEFFTISAPLALVRRAALEIGRRLTGRGVLDDPDHAFELLSDELRDGLLGDDATRLRDVVRRRLGERAWALAHPGPASYGTPPAPPSLAGLPGPARHAMEAFLWSTERIFGTEAIEAGGVRTDGVLAGVPASAGRWTGTVRVIHGEDEFARIQPGDVLVCTITSPVWSVVFPSIGALVTDTGGILSHPAIIAREYGIPAVVATREGTTRLRDGQVVLVDGSAGTVTAVDEVLS